MKKLSLTNLAQDQVKKEEAQRITAGAAVCACGCSCPPEYRNFDLGETRMVVLIYLN